MRVLINTVDLAAKGGVAKYSAAIMPHLGEGVDYFTVGARGANQSGWRRVLHLIGDFARYPRILIRGRYELVHLNPSLDRNALIRDAVFLTMARLARARTLVFIHGWDADCERVIHKHKVAMLLFRWVFSQADMFVVLAAQFRGSLRQMGITKPIEVKTTAVPNEVFSIIHKYPSIKRGGHRLLFLARIERNKGIYETIQAFRLLKQKYLQLRLTIAGSGKELGKAQVYVQQHGVDGIEFVGFVEDETKWRTLADADIYLFPTTYGEGMPISVLEAMAFGLPVVTRPVGGIGDFFQDGQMGFVSDSLDPKIFAELVGRLLDDVGLRRSISEFNRQYAAEHFKAEKVAGQVVSLYRRVVPNECAR